jgi:hypothetical protein
MEDGSQTRFLAEQSMNVRLGKATQRQFQQPIFSFGERTALWVPKTLFLEILGIKAGAHGRFAIVAVLLTFLVAGAGYLLCRTLGIW